MSDRYLWIPKWSTEPGEPGEAFQHYRKRDPKWIKNYTRLLSDDAYLELTGNQRAALHGIWLMFAAGHRKVAGRTASVSRRLHMRVTEATLDALNHAGFIEFIDSSTLAKRLQPAIPETERETEVEIDPLTPAERGQKPSPRSNSTNPRAKKHANVMRDFVHRFWDEYPDTDILADELTDRGCRRDEAEDLVAQERARRGEEVAAA